MNLPCARSSGQERIEGRGGRSITKSLRTLSGGFKEVCQSQLSRQHEKFDLAALSLYGEAKKLLRAQLYSFKSMGGLIYLIITSMETEEHILELCHGVCGCTLLLL